MPSFDVKAVAVLPTEQLIVIIKQDEEHMVYICAPMSGVSFIITGERRPARLQQYSALSTSGERTKADLTVLEAHGAFQASGSCVFNDQMLGLNIYGLQTVLTRYLEDSKEVRLVGGRVNPNLFEFAMTTNDTLAVTARFDQS